MELTGKERRLINSIRLFCKKGAEEQCFSINDELVAPLRKQLDSIIKQAVTVSLEGGCDGRQIS